MVSTQDSESCDPSSNLGEICYLFISYVLPYWSLIIFVCTVFSGGVNIEAGDRVRKDVGGQPWRRDQQEERGATRRSKPLAKYSRW